MPTFECSLNRSTALFFRFKPLSDPIFHPLDSTKTQKKKRLIRLAYEALPSGGAFIAVENLIDDERRENAFGLMMSLNMLIEFGDAFDFTGADFWSWCREAGFVRYEVLHLSGACSAAIAYK